MGKIFLSFARFCYLVGKHFNDDGCFHRAAALAYTTLLSIVPLLAVIFAVLSISPLFKTVGVTIQNFIFANFVPASGEIIQSHLQQFITQATHLSLISSVFLLVTSVMLLYSIEEALNHIWRVSNMRRSVRAILLYLALLIFVPLLLIIGFILSSYVLSLSVVALTVQWLGLAKIFLLFAPFLLSIIAFTLLYVAVPNCRVPFAMGLVGGLVAAILFEFVKRGFALYVETFTTYQLLYGALSVIPFFLVWIYLTWLVILFGAEVSHVLMIRKQKKALQ
jgi:membrane protein